MIPACTGSDRNLVHAIAGDAHERIILLAWLPAGGALEIAAQRETIDRPCGLPQPRSLIVGIALDPDQIEGGALHPVRRREYRRQVRIARALVGQGVLEQHQSLGILEQHAQGEAALAIALVARPQGDQLPTLFPGQPAGGEELRRAHRSALRGDAAGKRCRGDAEGGEVHGRVIR